MKEYSHTCILSVSYILPVGYFLRQIALLKFSFLKPERPPKEHKTMTESYISGRPFHRSRKGHKFTPGVKEDTTMNRKISKEILNIIN